MHNPWHHAGDHHRRHPARIFNVTECSTVAVIYAPLVGDLIYRELSPQLIYAALVRTARTTAVIMLVIAGAQIVSWLLAYQQIPQQIADIMLSATRSLWIFLLLVNLLPITIGTLIENGPALVMLAPVLCPIAAKFGADPYHFSTWTKSCMNLCRFSPQQSRSCCW